MLKYIVLGFIQGVTEFLPVSSSGHLLVLEKLFGLSDKGLEISIVLHLATLFSVLVFFYKDILELLKDKKVIGYVFLVTVITGVIGVLGKDFFESLFSSTKAVGVAWIFTGILLLLTKKFSKADKKNVTFVDSVIVGFTQAVAIIPGVSRAGMTISTLLFRKIEQQKAFSFSFIISIPVILGAVVLEVRKIGSVLKFDSVNLLVGFLTSFFVGLFALWILKAIMNKAKFYCFGYYCFFIAILTLIFIK